MQPVIPATSGMPTILRVIVAVVLPMIAFGQPAKKTITREADVPRFQYAVGGPVEDLIKSEATFRPFAARVRQNVESVLRDFDIEDAATRRSLLSTIASLDLLEGRDGDARKKLDEVKALEEKPAQKQMSGLIARAILEARRVTKDPASEQYRRAVHDAVKRALDAMPYEVVQNEVKAAKADVEMVTEGMLIGQLQAQLDPVVKKTGGLSSDFAHQLPSARMMLVEQIPMKATLTEAFATYLAAHKTEKRDIWADRDVVLTLGGRYGPINVAVWDSGVDLAVFNDQVAKDRSGAPAVLAYDINSRKSSGAIYPLSADQARRFPEGRALVKGFLDLQANVESEEATQLRQRLAQLKPVEVGPFLEELYLYVFYSHGTHVAGILLAGNPYARLLTGRLTLDHKIMPDPCPSRDLSERSAAGVQDFVRFFKTNGVRVVNMSWGGSVKDVEGALEKCAIGKNTEERKPLARQFFEIEKNGLEKAIRSSPEILYVAAAGNSNADSSFEETIPASLKLPNLLTVGAVDQAGDEAPFTSYGPTVAVHANGYEVESYLPGGARQKASGTSVASPNVANLAAKMLAVNPRLTPVQVIEIIRTTADKTEDGRRFLINSSKAVAAARK